MLNYEIYLRYFKGGERQDQGTEEEENAKEGTETEGW